MVSRYWFILNFPGAPVPNAAYSTIGGVVTAAAPGDAIVRCPALYQEQLAIAKPLTLVGIGEDWSKGSCSSPPPWLTFLVGY